MTPDTSTRPTDLQTLSIPVTCCKRGRKSIRVAPAPQELEQERQRGDAEAQELQRQLAEARAEPWT